MTPWGTAPPAKADFGLDDLFDLIDPNLAAAAVPAADPSVLADAFQQDFWVPLHTSLEDWINSPLGAEIDNNVINPLFSPLTQLLDQVFAPGTAGFCGIICDGIPGTFADPNGGDGGLWFGDGGAGYDASEDPYMAGGVGGSAGGWGNGGDGGDGGFAAVGGLGGAGGEGFGNGGNGGDGGDGGEMSSFLNALQGPVNSDEITLSANASVSSGDGASAPGAGGAGGPTGNYQDWLGYFALGNGGDGGMGGTGYYVDGASGGPGGDGSLLGGSGGAGGDAIGGSSGSAGSAPTGIMGGPGGAGGTIDDDG